MTFGFVVQRKPAPDARVLKIRDYEDKLYAMQQGVQVSVLVGLVHALTSWSHTSRSRSVHTMMTNDDVQFQSLENFEADHQPAFRNAPEHLLCCCAGAT